MSNKGNQVATGTNTMVWINGQPVSVKSFEYKISVETEDVKFPNDLNTYKRTVGMTCEGTITVNKTESVAAKLVAGTAKTGLNPDITITSKIINDSTGKAERAAFRDVVISEYGASSENGGLLEESIPFSSSIPEFIEYM
ncbi:hypothetical protein D3C75_473790 [compost metagenome]